MRLSGNLCIEEEMSGVENEIVPILGILSAALMLLATIRAARGLPQASAEIDPKAPGCYGMAEINGTMYNVKYLVDGNLLIVASVWPRFALTLDMSTLHLEKRRALIGTQVRVTPSDRGEWRMFKEMVISHYSAKRIEKMSQGAFGYSRIMSEGA
jgi:hypothetical protein